MQAVEKILEESFVDPGAKKRNDVSDLKPGAILPDVSAQRVCRGGAIAECDSKQHWRQ